MNRWSSNWQQQMPTLTDQWHHYHFHSEINKAGTSVMTKFKPIYKYSDVSQTCCNVPGRLLTQCMLKYTTQLNNIWMDHATITTIHLSRGSTIKILQTCCLWKSLTGLQHNAWSQFPLKWYKQISGLFSTKNPRKSQKKLFRYHLQSTYLYTTAKNYGY